MYANFDARFSIATHSPRQMWEVWVGGAGNKLTANLPEFLGTVGEGDDLGGTDKGEVKGVKEEDEVLPLVVTELNLLELSIHHRRPFEGWGRLGEGGNLVTHGGGVCEGCRRTCGWVWISFNSNTQ